MAFGFTGFFGFDRAAVVFLAAGLDFAAVVDFGFDFVAAFGFFGFDLAVVDFAVEPFDDPAPVRVRGFCPDLLVAILFPF